MLQIEKAIQKFLQNNGKNITLTWKLTKEEVAIININCLQFRQ